MNYQSLIRRLRNAAQRHPDAQRIRLYIHRSEIDSLLNSLDCVHRAAQRGYATPAELHARIESLHETMAGMNREIVELQKKIAAQPAQHEFPLPQKLVPDFPHNRRRLDAWQQRILADADQRNLARGRC